MMRSGLALIVVVGVLGVMAVLAAAFVTMAQLERKASQQRVNAERAYLLAKSGIEDAAARLALGQDASYGGEDWDADGKLSTLEAANEVYHPTGVGTPADIDTCPVRHAMRPSFFAVNMTDVDRRPLLVSMDGKLRGFSGRLSDHYTINGNTYALKASSQGGFYINGGDPSQRTVPGSPPFTPASYNDVLKRILGTLADAIDHEDGAGDGNPVAAADSWKLIDTRPSSGWQSFEQIRDVAFAGDPNKQTKLDALKPYLTLHAWVDKRVIRPNATPAMIGRQYHSWGEIKLDRGGAPVLEPRAPVNLAWARKHRPALIALIGNLQGLFIDYTTERNWDGGSVMGNLRSARIALDWTAASDDCRTMVDGIMTSTSDLATWQEFNAFCDTLPTTDAGLNSAGDPWGAGRAVRDLLKANFNPNSDLNKFNPGLMMWKLVDKSDLLAYSTEFSLTPLDLQDQDVESVGRVLSPDGRLLAGRTLRASLAGLSVARLSTQNDFVCESLGDLDSPGAEGNPRRPGFSVGSAPAYLTQGQFDDIDHRTWGHALNTVSADPNYAASWMNGASNGSGLQVYPEPYSNAGSGLSINPANYDGNLQLATVETPTNDAYGAAGADPPFRQMTMLARFDDGFDLDLSAAGTSSPCVTDTSMVTASQLGNSIWDPTKPSTLYPDGAYSEIARAPSYLDRGGSPAFHGVLSFWVKPAILLGIGRVFLMRTNMLDPPPITDPPGETKNQCFGLAEDSPGTFQWRGLGFFFENGHQKINSDNEHKFFLHRYPPGHAWTLITAAWDFLDPTNTRLGKLIVDDGTPDHALGQKLADVDAYVWPKNDWKVVADITLPDLNATGATVDHKLTLGAIGYRDQYALNGSTSQGADATFDEFAIYDFGGAVQGARPTLDPPTPASPDDMGASVFLAKARYKEGRYYKGWKYNPSRVSSSPAGMLDEAGAYYTGPINLPAGSMIRKIAWTWYRPDNSVVIDTSPPIVLPDDYAEIALVSTDCKSYLLDSDPTLLGLHSRSYQVAGWTPDRQDWDVNGIPPEAFRIQVLFRRVTPLGGASPTDETHVKDIPILESPVLDDLTILYQPGGGMKIFSWGEGSIN